MTPANPCLDGKDEGCLPKVQCVEYGPNMTSHSLCWISMDTKMTFGEVLLHGLLSWNDLERLVQLVDSCLSGSMHLQCMQCTCCSSLSNHCKAIRKNTRQHQTWYRQKRFFCTTSRCCLAMGGVKGEDWKRGQKWGKRAPQFLYKTQNHPKPILAKRGGLHSMGSFVEYCR